MNLGLLRQLPDLDEVSLSMPLADDAAKDRPWFLAKLDESVGALRWAHSLR